MRTRRCPICGKPAAEPDSGAFPFCSKRCRQVDLGNWLGESYKVPDFGAPELPAEDWQEGMS